MCMSFFKKSVKFVASTVPIVRALTQDTAKKGIDKALMDTFGVSAGVAMMFLNVFQDKSTDSPELRLGKMYGTMIIGMAAGMFEYSSGAITDKYIDIELTERAKSAKREDFRL